MDVRLILSELWILLFVQELPKNWKQEQEEYRYDVLNSLGQVNELLQCGWSVHVGNPCLGCSVTVPSPV